MTPLAVGLVLASALVHASWNLLAKNASASPAFAWLCSLSSVAVTAPIVAVQIIASGASPDPTTLVYPAMSGVIQAVYFQTLTRAYRAGDLSLVYPIARGSGPLLAVVLSIVILAERPSPIAIVGIGGILLGVLCLTGDPRAFRASGNARAVGYALATGALIACYTLWDKYGVSVVGVSPLLYFVVQMLTCTLLLTPGMLRNPEKSRSEISAHWKPSMAAGALLALAYTLVLTALVTSPVAYVAPMREIGILFGAILGHRLLAEGQTRQRLAGSALMVLGVAALAIG
jgi:drug/metabolite transporter (DMT)-like permease